MTHPSPQGRDRRSALIFVNRYFLPDLSATSQMVGDLATSLAARGMKVSVITSMQRHDRPKTRLMARETIDGVDVRRVATTRFGRRSLIGRAADYVTFHAAAALAVLRLARRNDVVVACTDPPLLSVSLMVPILLSGARQVNWLHDVFPETASALGVIRNGGVADRILRWARDLSLRGAAANVVLGDRMARRISAGGVPAARIRIIHNFADPALISPEDDRRNPLREAWGLRDRFIVGYSGNLGRAHEFETILSAAEHLRHRADIAFLLVGDGHHRERVAALARQRGLDNILLRPLQPREALSRSLGVPDVHLVSLLPCLEGLVVPSKFYGIAAAGRPTLFIGDSDGEIARILRRHDCGGTVAVGAGEALAAQVAHLAASPAVRRRWAENARSAFDRFYSREKAVTQWLDLLSSLRQRAPGRAAEPAAAISEPKSPRTAGGSDP